MILDSQVHSWYTDRPSRPWIPEYRVVHREKPSYLQHAAQTNSPDMALVEMAEAGVDGALLTPIGVYGVDMELELEASERHPDNFQTIALVDHLAEDVHATLAAGAARGLRGVRILGLREPDRVARREFDRLLDALRDLGLVATFSMAHPVDPKLVELIRGYPEIFFYIDHLGTGYAPPILGWRPPQPFEHLATVLELARSVPNLGLKLSGAPSLSAEDFPFRDIWEPVTQLVRAFGVDRVSWGSDYTRVAPLSNYTDNVRYLAEIPGFSPEELQWMYAQTLIERTGWHPAPTIIRS